MEVEYYSLPEEVMEDSPTTQSDYTYLHNRLNQVLAQWGLHGAPGQWPLAIQVGGVTVADAAVRRIHEYQRTVSALSPAPKESIIPPQLLPSFRYLGEDQGAASTPPLMTFGNHIQALTIERQIPSEGMQGSLYEASVAYPPLVFEVSLLDRAGVASTVPAVVKKSPIYSPEEWEQYRLMGVSLKAANEQITAARQDIAETEDAEQRLAYERRLLMLERFTAPVRSAYAEYENVFAQDYVDPKNDAYADAIGYYLGSLLYSTGLSPFHPLLYGTMRMFDDHYFDRPAMNERFPVQVTIIQRLDGGVPELRDSFYNVETVLSLLAQVAFGIHIAYSVFGLVNNDLHLGNVLYQEVSTNHMLYYTYFDADLVQRYLAVPTFGKVYKMIDFGRATFHFGGGGSRFPERQPRWGSTPRADFLAFLYDFLLQTNNLHTLVSKQLEQDAFGQLAYMATLCETVEEDPQPVDIAGKAEKTCQLSMEPYAQCLRKEVIFGAYRPEYYCKNALPARLVGYFAQYYTVDRASIPADAIIYPLL